jgi:hypothetical protein
VASCAVNVLNVVVIICAACLGMKKSFTFCGHSIFTYFVWFSQKKSGYFPKQHQAFRLYDGEDCVLCEVGNELR